MMRLRIVLTLAMMGAFNARAAVPVVESVFPLGGQQGTSVSVKAEGKFDAWPARVWTDTPGIHVEAGKETGTFTFRIDKDVSVGPHLVRFYTDDGAAPARVFFVTDAPEIREIEPNDDGRRAQEIPALPVTVNGQLEKSGDVDCYAVHLDAGQRLVASVEGRRLGSPIDPMLHVIDAEGIEQRFAHDGLGLDPVLAYQPTRSGRYIVRVSAFAYPPASDVKLAGGKGDYYRLHLTTGPFTRFGWPTGVRRGERASLKILGWNTSSASMLLADATNLPIVEDHLFLPCPGEGRLRVEVGDGPELLDDAARKPGSVLTAPVSISGRITKPGEIHRFPLAVKKGEAVRAILRAGTINSPLDAQVEVTGPGGIALAKGNGDGGPSNLILKVEAPADGICTVSVSDLFGKSGEDYVYRLELIHPEPAIRATLDAHAYAVAPGKSASVKVSVTRLEGHMANLIAVATNLPAGVTATSADVPVKGGEVTLILAAAADAKPASGILHVMLLGIDPAKQEIYPVRYVRQESEGAAEMVPQADPWLVVRQPPR